MTVWQKRARFGVAVLGLAFAVIVYFGIGRRPPPVTQAAVKRIDPAASAEGTGGNVQRFHGDRRDFELSYDTQLSYADGSTRLIKVTINVKKSDGHSYLVTAGEARSTRDQNDLQLSSGVHLKADDGFEMTTEHATYSKDTGAVHSDAPIMFLKARMNGSGTDVDYNENSDVLTIGKNAHVTTVDEEGKTTLDFSAGTAVLDRLQEILTMDGRVHVLRDQQVMDADRATAHLAPHEEFITFLELRGNSHVDGGGGALEAMSARDIDLDYTEDGKALERVALNGEAGVTLTGTNGAAGRTFTGGALEMKLGSDGMVTSATGRENVSMVLPSSEGSPARTIRGRMFDSTGSPGQGLTAAHFTDAVEYSEEATRTVAGRVVHARRLDLALAADAVTDATFTTDVTFEEPSFRAQSANARYDPTGGTLHLTGSDSRGLPCVADDQIAVDAQTIDVTVETRRLTATGGVKTTIRPAGAKGGGGSSPCAIARQRSAGAQSPRTAPAAGDTRLPGLLKQDQIATAAADALEYGGTGGRLVYTGMASLVQGETSLRGNVIRIDQDHGDLTVTGGARIFQSSGDAGDQVDGRAEEIRYTDARRLVSYLNAPSGATKAETGKLVQVNGPQGNLTANRVDMFLRQDSGRAERLEAYQNVSATIDSKRATADRLTYLAETEQYDMKGAGAVPVRIVDSCGETSGKTLTYYKADNRIVVRGNDEMRTLSKSSACQQPPASSR